MRLEVDAELTLKGKLWGSLSDMSLLLLLILAVLNICI